MRSLRLILVLTGLLTTCPHLSAQTLKEVNLWRTHDEPIACLVFSPDGKTLATCSRSLERKTNTSWGVVKLWDVGTGKERLTLEGHKNGVSALAFSPDGKLLASAASDGEAIVWDLEARKERLTVKEPTSWVRCLRFGDDGKSFGTANDKVAVVWDAETGKRLGSVNRPVRGNGAAFSPDLKTLASPNYQDVDLWDVASEKPRLVLEDHRCIVTRTTFSADGRTLFAAGYRHLDDRTYRSEIRLWNAVTGKEVCRYEAPFGAVGNIALSPDGKLLALAGSAEPNAKQKLKLVEAANGRELASVSINANWLTPTFSPDGKWLAVAAGSWVRLYEVTPP